jgi:hypothetical protein
MVLMVDGDEVPSHALLDALPALVSARSDAQYRIARRWCWPDPDHWLDERPWWPDLQRRLVATDAGVDVDVRFHGGIRERLPVRIVMEPIYHLVCLLRPLADRRSIGQRYERARPGVLAVGGGEMNEVLYAPERHATRPLATTPPEDAALLRRVIDAPDAEPVDLVPEIVTADEIAEHVPDDPIELGGYRVRLAPVESDLRTEPSFNTTVLVAVTNDGDVTIPHADGPGVRVRMCTRVLDRRAGAARSGWISTSLLGDIPPGETRVVESMVVPPADPGIYTLEFDLVNEEGRSFGATGVAELVVASRWGRFEFIGWERRGDTVDP